MALSRRTRIKWTVKSLVTRVPKIDPWTEAMPVEDEIRRKLKAAFAPEVLEVVNDSHRHAGHPGSPGTGESHFTVKVVSRDFEGKSRIERHRMVNQVLAEELAGSIHALAVSALTPSERARVS